MAAPASDVPAPPAVVAAEQALARVPAEVAVSQLAEPVGAAAHPARVLAGVAVSQLAEPVGAAARPVRVPAGVAVSQLAEPVGAAARPVRRLPLSGRAAPTSPLPALPPQ
ncbi:MAG TPA: hypothetical protein VHT74_10720 [Acetobacteraceae bacterium]|nr:hypothetical protein [Acetobacteraceae bacterium]